MLSFRGDVHKFYLKLKRTLQKNKSIHDLSEIKEINEIRQFYLKLSIPELMNIRYRMIKEQNGSGMIPIFFASIPWVGFVFSKQLQSFLFKDGTYLWAWFITIYGLILTASFIIHYREKAWASVHVEIIEDTLRVKEREEHS